MNDAFDRAWALVKMPYHGTDEETAKKIMRDGTRAFRDKRRGAAFRHPAKFWMTNNPNEAMRHARLKGARGKRVTDTDDYRETGFSRPTVLHISDEGVDSVPHEKRQLHHVTSRTGIEEYITHGHPDRIDPKHISIHSQGPKPNIPEPFDWSNEGVVSSEGLAHDQNREKAIADYKNEVYNWRADQ
tara:strand:+ start:300 stop:857 length:558 start_codon:yes stop_codon:yes gene_type:complete